MQPFNRKNILTEEFPLAWDGLLLRIVKKKSKFSPESPLTLCVTISKAPNISKMNIVASS